MIALCMLYWQADAVGQYGQVGHLASSHTEAWQSSGVVEYYCIKTADYCCFANGLKKVANPRRKGTVRRKLM
jgi:hypothetical protein